MLQFIYRFLTCSKIEDIIKSKKKILRVLEKTNKINVRIFHKYFLIQKTLKNIYSLFHFDMFVTATILK